jgi:hypothetical protein
MAVYQISKIQIRRGQAGQGTGVPILASGELAWAIDTQELWIGNGSEAEGSPNPRQNTKIFTSQDSVFEFTKYIYEENLQQFAPAGSIQTGRTLDTPTLLNVQDVLDRIVFAENFGVKPPLRENSDFDPGDVEVYPGVTLNTEAFQRAINEIFLNPSLKNDNVDTALEYGKVKHDFKVELRFTPGIYRISRTIYLPSYVYISGAGIDKTIFDFTGIGPVFKTINDSAFPLSTAIGDRTYTYEDQDPDGLVDPFDYGVPFEQNEAPAPTTQTNRIDLRDFTIRIQSPSINPAGAVTAFQLDSIINSTFKNIKVVGQWLPTNTTPHHYGMNITGFDNFVTSKKNKFENIQFVNLRVGLESKYDIIENTFEGFTFDTVDYGVLFGVGTDTVTAGQLHGPRKNLIRNSTFSNVSKHGILVETGYGNKSRGNTFINVGNDGDSGGDAAKYSHIKMCPGNSSLHDTFDRFTFLSNNRNFDYIPEVEGTVYHQALETYKIDAGFSNGIIDAFRVPLNNATGYKVTYVYESTSGTNMVRRGELNIAIDKVNNTVQLSDTYEFSGNETTAENLEFFTELLQEPNNSSLVIKFNNRNIGDVATLTFTYSVLV